MEGQGAEVWKRMCVRGDVAEYQKLRSMVHKIVGCVNGQFTLPRTSPPFAHSGSSGSDRSPLPHRRARVPEAALDGA